MDKSSSIPGGRPRVKVCGMTRPADARLALSFGADFIGVIRYGKSPRFADDAAMAAVLAEVPSGHRVWVGVDPEPAELEDALRQGFDFLQIHFPVDVPEARIAGWAAVAGPARMWLAPRLEPGTTPSDAVARHCQTLLLDAHSPNAFGGTGRTGDWTAFERCRAERPSHRLVLAGGLNPSNLAGAVERLHPWAVDLNSGVESAPGQKDPAKLRAAFAVLSVP